MANPLALIDLATSVIARVWPDPAQQAEAQRKLAELQQTGELAELDAQLKVQLGQIDINKLDAQGNVFQSGWRPAIGWSCAIAIFCYYVPYVIAATVLWVVQVVQSGVLQPRPDLGVADLIGLTLSMLGMAGLRTAEKKWGVSK